MPLLTDPAAIAGLVAREIRTSSRDGAPTKIAVARRAYPTDQADLWDALTNVERIPRWFLPVSGDLSVGGHYQIEGNASGMVEQCEPPQRFAVTWEMGPQVSWLDVSLTTTDGGTLLELVHEAHVDPGLWTQFGPGAIGVGWDLALMGLGLHISTREEVDQAVAMTFPATPEGVEFIRASAVSWADAAIADGDDSASAHRAAEQTVGFYTVAPEESPES
ncbi:SRPBCC family protein [Nocardia sp. NPDC050408]|uniref:SRPBCC family protein n=1 Tax=Nocardia sp. NPDC050408 TaxID=3364319 RepID=UPI0037AE58A7